MITLDLSILNQKGTPMFNSDLFANRPAAGIVGRIFISTDTNALFRDTGSTWVSLGGGGGGTIGGSIATGQVAFGTAANTIGGTNNLFWDSVNERLGIGTNTPTNILDLSRSQNNPTAINITNATSNTNARAGVSLISNTGNGQFSFQKYSTLHTAYKIISASDGSLYNDTAGSISILNDFATGNIKFSAGGSATAQMTLFSTGNLSLGTTTDIGQRLFVSGNTIMRSSGNTFGVTALAVQNVNGDNILRVVSSGTLLFGNFGSQIYADSYASPLFFYSTVAGQAANNGAFRFFGDNFTQTSGNPIVLNINPSFVVSSGNANLSLLALTSTINQTGTANGLIRGLYVNPTLTAAADWRSIQWDNNTGWGLFGNGTAPNYFAGNVQIGSTTPIASDIKLQVTGRGQFNDTRTYTTGAAISFAIIKDLTINSAISGSTGIVNNVQAGTNIIGASLSVPSSTTFASLFSYNTYQFASAGLTLTATQPGAGAGIRAVSQITTQNVFNGANSGTITHVAGVQINGFYNNNTGTSTPVITNAYQLLINDTGEFAHTFSFTNRWAIYQPGINDRNYLAGNLLLNSTTDTGQILQVNGAIRVNGQASGTAGGASGQHLIINVDGTQYKIALLNP